ncbi:hypothetical protein K8R47_03040 [archaeon]|nr:hypothetical protein [archaeon]
MDKDSFLDTNVIFHYSNYIEKVSKNILKRCYLFIQNKKGEFILCGAVLSELSRIIKKRVNIHKAVIGKIKDSNSLLEEFLSPRDVPYAKQLYEQFKNEDVKKVSLYFADQRHLSEIKIDKFLKTKVDEKVIPLGQIDNSLVNKINEIISNHADCKILASAIQFQNTRAIFLFVTADGKDLDPNDYKYLQEHFEINYSNEKCKFPELLNLMFTT